MRGLLVFLLLIVIMAGCYYDSREFLYPEIGSGCDTTNVTFSATVQPMLEQYCYSCHSNNNAGAFGSNIRLQAYQDVKQYADNGRLLGAVLHNPGYSPMPKGSQKLNACMIQNLQTWIMDNSPNN